MYDVTSKVDMTVVKFILGGKIAEEDKGKRGGGKRTTPKQTNRAVTMQYCCYRARNARTLIDPIAITKGPCFNSKAAYMPPGQQHMTFTDTVRYSQNHGFRFISEKSERTC